MSVHDYTEDQLVEQPAIGLFEAFDPKEFSKLFVPSEPYVANFCIYTG